jgi:hypothetical protein
MTNAEATTIDKTTIMRLSSLSIAESAIIGGALDM